MRMKDKCGIVTAAASGMGRAGTLLLAREGAKVCVVDRDAAGAQAVVDEIRAAGGTAFAIGADLRDLDIASGLVARAVAEFGALDFLWNHLGHPGPAAVEGLDWNDFDLALDLNIRSQLASTIAALPELRARGGGSILFTASTSGMSASTFSPVYSGMKAGVIGLVRGLAKRYAREGIRVNAVCPGPFDTPMAREFVDRKDQTATKGMDREELVQKFGASTAMGRAGRPEEVGYAALFLLSDEASFITGAYLPVDGGLLA
ncbi:SDR family oxidoreductase [Xanthobacter dioxanivorans]|uniref:SDR family oxidoreductase n=1 Tax=Xanthobacter dioxanivorans TaxID=2528964 RepID=A0A974SJ31_9HYPH|nr:SDR family oxidoreductase [Xanthobacter dioxanivorans]QRG07360.1 SDR family oxidoreductase [Xanthobacter dioxanivorans]